MVKEITGELAQRVINGAFLHCRDIHDHTCEYEAFGNPLQLTSRTILPCAQHYLEVLPANSSHPHSHLQVQAAEKEVPHHSNILDLARSLCR